MTSAVSWTVDRAAGTSVTRLFDTVVAEDVLAKVLHRFLVVPAVIGTTDLSGAWSLPGSTRTVLTSDGRRLREKVTEWQRPSRFAYRVSGFSGAIGKLVSSATGEWDFGGDDATGRFSWTYAFQPKHRLVTPLVRVFVATLWAGYMRRCAGRCVALAEEPGP